MKISKLFLFLVLVVVSTTFVSATMVNFTSGAGSWTVPAGVTSVQVLVVAGGGAGGSGSLRGGNGSYSWFGTINMTGGGGGGVSGGNGAGGGGAGGLKYNASYPTTPGATVSYKVGVGGTVGVGSGGSGVGFAGGSGGGAGDVGSGIVGGSNVAGQGYKGGNVTNNVADYCGAGGGGSLSRGINGGNLSARGGNASDYSAIFGTSLGVSGKFAGGGGGGCYQTRFGSGGGAGAGNGGNNAAGSAATANTGSGGGGTGRNNNGGAGGSGIIIIKYTAAINYIITAKSKYDASSITSFSVRIQNGTTVRNYYTSTGTISKITSGDYRKYNITFFNVTNHYNLTYSSYNFSASGNLVGNLTLYSIVPFTAKSFSNTTVLLNSTSYTDLIVGTFVNPSKLKMYSSSLIQVYGLTSGQYYCRNLINNIDYDSEQLFNLSTDVLNSFNLLSNITNVSSSSYSYRVQCKKFDSLQPNILISQIDSFILLSNRTSYYSFNLSSNSTSWRNIQNITYSMTPRISSPLYRNLIIDAAIPKSSQIRIVYNNSNITHQINSQNQNLIYLLKENITSSSVLLKIYVKGNSSGNYRFLVTENVDFNNRSQSKIVTTNTLLNTAYYKNITNLNVSIASLNKNLLVKGMATVYSPVADDVGFKIKYGTNVKYYLKSIQAGETTIFDFENIYENLSTGGSKIFYLQAYSALQQSIIRNLSFSSLVTDRIVLTDSHFNVTVYKNYSTTPTKIQNFTIWYNGNEYSTSKSSIEIFAMENQLVNLTIGSNQNGGYYNRTITGFNTSFDLSTNLYQTENTFIFKHSLTNQTILANILMNDTTYNKVYTVNSGVIKYLPSGYINFKFRNSNYSLKIQNFTLLPRTTSTNYIYLYPIVNISIYDEKTEGLFDITSPDKITMTSVCNGSNQDVTVNKTWVLVNATCVIQKIKFIVDYPTESYYRTYPIFVDTVDINNFNFRVWLLNLNTSTVNYNTFTANQLSSQYINLKILFYKTIGNQEYLITGDTVDLEQKVSAWFLKNEEYTVKIVSDNQPERNMGNFFADISSELVIRLFDITLGYNLLDYDSDVRAYAYLVNETGTIRVRAAVNDSSNSFVDHSTFVVRKNSRTGPILCSQSSLIANVLYSCDLLPANVNDIIFTELTIIDVNGNSKPYEKIMRANDVVPYRSSVFKSQNTFRWIIFCGLLVFGFTLTITTSAIGGVALVLFAGFLKLIGWLDFSMQSTFTTAQNIATGAALIGVLIVLSFAWLMRKGEGN